MDVFRDLMRERTIFQSIFRDARVKARGAGVACDYNPATPEDDEGNGGVDQNKEDAWYEDECPKGGGDGKGADGVVSPGSDQ